jgi:hypothetical protein
LENLKQSYKLTRDLIKYFDNEVGKKDDLERLEWLDERINVKGLVSFLSFLNILQINIIK